MTVAGAVTTGSSPRLSTRTGDFWCRFHGLERDIVKSSGQWSVRHGIPLSQGNIILFSAFNLKMRGQ